MPAIASFCKTQLLDFVQLLVICICSSEPIYPTIEQKREDTGNIQNANS
jgi:hypothetical protein